MLGTFYAMQLQVFTAFPVPQARPSVHPNHRGSASGWAPTLFEKQKERSYA
jgi:hypothetical protein